VPTAIVGLVSLAVAWVLGTAFAWINVHSIEVASFLTFYSGKPVSHVLIENIYDVIEGLLWVVIGGFLLSFVVDTASGGWWFTLFTAILGAVILLGLLRMVRRA